LFIKRKDNSYFEGRDYCTPYLWIENVNYPFQLL
jgi:hypothetical protein